MLKAPAAPPQKIDTFEPPADTSRGRSEARGDRKFRPDVEGLRAIAVLTVVFAHAGLVVHGGYIGVDVFFVISGFLITRQLVEELERDGRVSFSRFYARRARRILPAGTLVIVATLLGAWAWMSPLRIPSLSRDAIASALSVVNFRLAEQGTNYFNAGAPPSALQHYWSLSVEEQFYACWPLLLFGLFLLGRRRRGVSVVAWGLVAIIVVSFALSVIVTSQSASWAYFGTQTRAWELALGALLAVGLHQLNRLPRALSAQMAWLGLGMILLAAFLFDGATAYPGSAVALPVVGAALVIAGGSGASRRGAELVLGRRPMQFFGRISYSLYLWHWPILILAPLALGRALSTGDTLLAILLAIVLAYVTFRLVEQPFRTRSFFVRRPSRGLVLGGVLVAASFAVAITVSHVAGLPGGTTASAARVAAPVAPPASRDPYAGVRHLVAVAAHEGRLPSGLAPALTQAHDDIPGHCNKNRAGRCWFGLDSGFCMVTHQATAPALPCNDFGAPAATARKTVVLYGDSHANMWIPAFEPIARARHWRLVVYTKPGCPPEDYPKFILPTFHAGPYVECTKWRDAVFAQVKKLHPAYIFFGAQSRFSPGIEPNGAGMARAVDALEASGGKVVYLEDVPRPRDNQDVPDCVALHLSNKLSCAATTDEAGLGSPQRMVERAQARQAGALLVDPTAWFCTKTVCPVVIDGMLVYADDSHITATYARWLTPELRVALARLRVT
jgi:peptidoglycan/LPS O-acetylase OafA/YrhL